MNAQGELVTTKATSQERVFAQKLYYYVTNILTIENVHCIRIGKGLGKTCGSLGKVLGKGLGKPWEGSWEAFGRV